MIGTETETLPCSRCGRPLPGTDADEVRDLAAIFKRAPLVLCDACVEGDSDTMTRTSAGTKKKDRALPAWPEQWPQRAILDLPLFVGAPLEKAQRTAARLERNGTIAIIGDRGRGKTVMATWLADQRRRRYKNPGTYVRSHDLFATIRRAWHPQSKEDEWTVLERYRTTPLLVIDEFQERSESAWENRTLVNILDHRHASILPTILIANLTAKAFGDSVGASLVDRIAQTGGIVECGWGNLRRG
ncbi:MAG: ATP-binding protein [Roseimicrobium sp.]